MVQGKKILLGVTGSIAAYKAILLVRLLVKAGAEVKVLMTAAARDFVTELSLSTISRHPVLVHLSDEGSWTNHVMLGRWADVMLVAPLSCNSLAKMAQGQCDNLLMATYLSATCPVVLAPAMDEDMWHHPATQANLLKLRSYGHQIIPVEHGELASGLRGDGRMAEPEHIIRFLEENIFVQRDLEGKRAVVTAGPTHEPIDPVRFISNRSSGKMGIALARELSNRGASVTLVLGPTSIEVNLAGVEVVHVQTAEEMYQACISRFPQCDIAVMAAAVADYSPALFSPEKIKKSQDGALQLELLRTKDILRHLGEIKKSSQVLVGFALENHHERDYARQKLVDKKADMIVLNSLNDPGAGFGHDSNKITIFEKSGAELVYDMKSKQQVAKDIVDRIVNLAYA